MRTAFFFAFICIIGIMAPDNVSGQAKIGIRAGVVSAKQDVQNGNIADDYASKLGADIALIADFPIGVFSISPEFHWMQKGGKLEDINGSAGEVSRTFNYLEIPLLFKFTFGQKTNFFLFGGPSAGYLLNGTDKDMDGNTNDVDLDFYKRAEFSLHAGGGIGLGPVRVDVRYIYGITDIFDDDTEVTITNSLIGAGVTLVF